MGRRLGAAVVVLAALCAPTAAQEASGEAAWVAAARKAELTAPEIEHLGREKLVLSATERAQPYQVYDRRDVPPFITTDAVLAAYDATYEASIAEIERGRLRRLPGLLSRLWTELPRGLDRAEAGPAARRRTTLVLAIALRLLDVETPGLAAEDAALAATEAARIETAEGVAAPEWLGPYDRTTFGGIDYDAFRPQGAYAESADAARIYRAVRWLQVVPFREAVADEAAAARALAIAGRPLAQDLTAFASAWVRLLGPSDRAAPPWERAPTEGAVAADGWFRGPWPSRDSRTFSLLPASLPPDTQLLRDLRTATPDERLPCGLDVAAALGSAWAAARREEGAPRIERGLVPGRSPDTIIESYFGALAALVDAPEPDAPAFLASDAWRAKGVNAALASWAAHRHATLLAAPEDMGMTLGMPTPVQGFVEPDPEFFARLAVLAASSARAFEAAGFNSVESCADRAAERLRALAAWLADDVARKRDGHPPWDTAWRGAWLALQAELIPDTPDYGPGDETPAQSKVRLALIAQVTSLATAIEHDPASPRFQGLLAWCKAPGIRWDRLADVCRTLERMAHRQLRGCTWTEEEGEFLEGFGLTLRKLLGAPERREASRDSVPRVAAVSTASLAAPDERRTRHVGIGRPRDLWVLWPWKGEEHLCVGVVLPYHETIEDHRLTDAEWRARFAAGDELARPPLPAWTRPMRAAAGAK